MLPTLATYVVRPISGLALSRSIRMVATKYIHTTPGVKTSVPDVNHKFETEYTELTRDFLNPEVFYHSAIKNGIDFFVGVPDSLLKDFCGYVTQHTPAENHVISANEGNAVGIAAGYHLATNKTAMVYLQNSGLGNIVNPLLSLATPDVYSIPMLLLIGWRGEPGKKDEPQHIVQGEATAELLATLKIPFQILPDYEDGADKVLKEAREYMHMHKGPYALLVRKRTFLPYKMVPTVTDYEHSRESALKLVIEQLNDKTAIVGTTGMLSRELFELRAATAAGHHRDFLTVGSMGHASSIALGIALAQPGQEVMCLDGDGAFLMHMGAAATIGAAGCENLKHIVINNGAHDSVGGQPTNCLDEGFNLRSIVLGAGYNHFSTAKTTEEINAGLEVLLSTKGPSMLEIVVNKGGRKNLGRPTTSPLQNKAAFMDFLEDNAINAASTDL
eukprot:CFRG3983T1